MTLAFVLAAAVALLPLDKPPVWRDCTEMKPVPKADDGSLVGSCVLAEDGKRYEVVYRPGTRNCNAILNAKEPDDGYKHFKCQETFELMIRPAPVEPKHD